jgi:acyl-CoA thioesterase I
MNRNRLLIIVGSVLTLGGLFWFLSSTPNERIISSLPSREGGDISIIAFGDSLTAGFGLSPNESYPAQLEAALKNEGIAATIQNAGVNGETTAENKERAASIREQNPDVVLLGIGGNDALRQLPVEAAKNNIRDTIRTLKSGDNPPVVILLQMQAPPTSGLAYKQSFDETYESLAESEKVILVPFLSTKVFLNSENKLSDGIHLNRQGYQFVVTEYILPTLLQVLEKIEG